MKGCCKTDEFAAACVLCRNSSASFKYSRSISRNLLQNTEHPLPVNPGQNQTILRSMQWYRILSLPGYRELPVQNHCMPVSCWNTGLYPALPCRRGTCGTSWRSPWRLYPCILYRSICRDNNKYCRSGRESRGILKVFLLTLKVPPGIFPWNSCTGAPSGQKLNGTRV